MVDLVVLRADRDRCLAAIEAIEGGTAEYEG
jgi:hypothetical protein